MYVLHLPYQLSLFDSPRGDGAPRTQSYELPKVKLQSSLPSLTAYVSPEKTSKVMQILNTLSKSSSGGGGGTNALPPPSSASKLAPDSEAHMSDSLSSGELALSSESESLATSSNNNDSTDEELNGKLANGTAASEGTPESHENDKAMNKQLFISLELPEVSQRSSLVLRRGTMDSIEGMY